MNPDGHHSAKAFDSGANSTMKAQDLAGGVHGPPNQATGTEDKSGGSVLDAKGAIGKQFTSTSPTSKIHHLLAMGNKRIAQGMVGGTAQAIGGPFDKEGIIGKHFNKGGIIGDAAQSLADTNKPH
ncbi:MAG: hypothetical protein M1834_006031 [Cirrosporium novae-zelandiae]|nr:MAG: hypothetical protein M1834_006031 [Cirrosporium novae-zelandiae]